MATHTSKGEKYVDEAEYGLNAGVSAHPVAPQVLHSPMAPSKAAGAGWALSWLETLQLDI